MGGLGHFEVSSARGIPSSSYIKSSGSYTTTVQTLLMEEQRSKRYSWSDNHFVRCLPQGDKVIPPPHEQPGLIQKVHLELGHFGIKRTYSLFAHHYH